MALTALQINNLKTFHLPRPYTFATNPPSNKKKRSTSSEMLLKGNRQRPILPGRVQPSTFGTGELNFCVRYGNRWDLSVITTGKGSGCFCYPDNCTKSDSKC